MKNLQKFFYAAFSMLVFTAFSGCSSDDADSVQSAPQGTSRVKVHMTDAPGDYDAVFIEVVDVKVKASADAGEEGWVSLGPVTPEIYNLLELTGGVTVMLANYEIQSGFLGQIRLVLGDENTVIKNGVTYELNTPSAQQSGLKLQVNQMLQPNLTYDFLIDFDVEQSIVEAGGSGNFNLHPVLRVSAMANSGSITGVALVPGFQVLASVQVGNQTVSAYTNAEGVFHLYGIPAGTYQVTITPDLLSGVGASVVQNVTVTNGNITNMGVISL